MSHYKLTEIAAKTLISSKKENSSTNFSINRNLRI